MLVQFICASVKDFVFSWFLHHLKNMCTLPCLLHSHSRSDHLVHCSAIPTPLDYPGPSASFPSHLTPHRVGTPALCPQKILYICGCFYSLKISVLLHRSRKWKIIGISRGKEEKEYSSPLIIIIVTVVIGRYGISLQLNAVHSSVNPESKSSWGGEPFKQANLHMHLNWDWLSFMDISEVSDSSGIHRSWQRLSS